MPVVAAPRHTEPGGAPSRCHVTSCFMQTLFIPQTIRIRPTMERLRLVFLLCVINPVFLNVIDNILGDPVDFSATKICKKSGGTLTHRLQDDSTRRVADRDSFWRPGPGYRDRMSLNDSAILKSTNMNDNGLYELTCGPEDETLIQLYVILASTVPVTEGQAVTLNFHHISVGGTTRYVRCERNGELVFQVDLSSEVIRYGTGFEFRVSVSPDWKTKGNFSPTLKRVQLQDQGDYFFFALDEDRKRTGGSPVAVRMKVMTTADQITCPPPPVCVSRAPFA